MAVALLVAPSKQYKREMELQNHLAIRKNTFAMSLWIFAIIDGLVH
jgi:hypothetical protein